MMSAGSRIVGQLRRKLPDRVFTDQDSRFRASVDNLRLSFLPEAVIRVKEAEEVGTVLQLAHRHGVAVTARGAGSSSTGAAVPVRGGWVIDLSELNSIQIDPVSRMATVGAGVVTADLQQALEKYALFYPPDPSSKKFSTIGGNIACNAGGMRCVKYGVTRDYVLALEGFLADGSPVRWGLPLKKYVSGLNIRDLWIGSEGTLGIVTRATLRLLPKPADRWTAMFAFQTEAVALQAVNSLLQAGINPSILEFLDCQTTECAEQQIERPIFPDCPGAALLMIELDGQRGEVNAERRKLVACLQDSAVSQRVARDEERAEKIWDTRRTCSQSMFALGDSKLNEDVVVPVHKQEELVRYSLALKKEIGLATPTFGHAGDGNLHVHIMYNSTDSDEAERAKAGIKKLMRKVVDLGGVITGEHGIGLAKIPFIEYQHNEAELGAMRAVKNALDPKGILNPGKIFDPFEVWDHPTVDVRLPWDHR